MANKIKNRYQLYELNSQIHDWLVKNKPDLLDELLPVVNTADSNKQELLKLARSGEKRPHHKTKQGRALTKYTSTSTGHCNPDFTKQIKELAPSWFVHENTALIRKQDLLELASSGGKRPHQKTKQGRALYPYTSPSHGSYDPVFTKQIKELAPIWFENTALINKHELLELARSGAKRPSRKTKLGEALVRYSRSSHPSSDPEFVKQVTELAPSWFKNTALINKHELLELAHSGGKKPSRKTGLGQALYSFTSPSQSSYDPEFVKQLKELAPSWFRVKRK